ncbi:hypothetical protein [Acinetobacter baumannii]|uniref:hypothetical protein n=1 Tax=Acinetobacter baumannii TaxID=470 RepID=UPI00215E4DE3|nr:hypothetical protein [Acinetobacter baumannii]
MPYVSEQFILDARKNIKINVNKPETFAGLMLFLFCVEERKQQESYLKANMQEFQKLADKAFCFKNVDKNYNHKFWYGLLPKVIYAELSGDFPLGDSRQPTYKSLRPFDLVS